MTNTDERIEQYLDELLVELRGSPRMVRRVLAEAEAHLRDGTSNGLEIDEAIRRFGRPNQVAEAANRQTGVPIPVLLRQLVLAACLLAAIGRAAVGVSGLVAAGMDAAFGPTFVAGDNPTITYTANRCAEYRFLAPNATGCRGAAAEHHTGEVVSFRIAAGLLGVIGLAAWAVLNRRWRTTPASGALPPTLVPAVGAAVFAVAAAALAAQSLQAIGWSSTAGVGQWLSGAVVSAAVALAFAGTLLRALRGPSLNMSIS